MEVIRLRNSSKKKQRVYFLVLTGDFCVAKQFEVRFEPKKVECHLIPLKKKQKQILYTEKGKPITFKLILNRIVFKFKTKYFFFCNKNSSKLVENNFLNYHKNLFFFKQMPGIQ